MRLLVLLVLLMLLMLRNLICLVLFLYIASAHFHLDSVTSRRGSTSIPQVQERLVHTHGQPTKDLVETCTSSEMQRRLPFVVQQIDIGTLLAQELANLGRWRKEKRCLSMTVSRVDVGAGDEQHAAQADVPIESREVQGADALLVLLARVRLGQKEHACQVDSACSDSGAQGRPWSRPCCNGAVLQHPLDGQQCTLLLHSAGALSLQELLHELVKLHGAPFGAPDILWRALQPVNGASHARRMYPARARLGQVGMRRGTTEVRTCVRDRGTAPHVC
mmetsp:Transcript_19916/g.55073  ORF Transcript_19916/g.55073 Transcript_19916/m.55073 type:complete len:276 (-) Transcript_19916:678-1505(-)